MSTLLRSKLPTKQTLLQPKVVDAHKDLKHRQQRQKSYYDKGTSPLPQLNPGDVVHVQRGKVWEPAVVRASHVQPRSYLVQSQHGQLRRNRRHVIKTNELPALFVPEDQLLTATSVGVPHEREVPAAPPEPVDTQTTDDARPCYQEWSGRQDSGQIPIKSLAYTVL